MSNTENQNHLATALGLGAFGLGRYIDVTNIWYNEKEVKLDGYRFVSCRFDKCTLVLTSSNFEIENCFIGSDTTILFGNEITKPVRAFNIWQPQLDKKFPFFAPVRNSDGTLTIKA